jgi:hypothetical protein
MGDVEDVICQVCGNPADKAIYRLVEVAGTGWVNVALKVEDDDRVTAESDDYVQDVQYEDAFRHEGFFGCSNCGSERSGLDELVEFIDHDPIRWLQKHPPAGQLRLAI